MNKSIFTPKTIAVTALIAIAAFSRFLPHPPNFTAVGALALFGAATLENKQMAFLVPVLAMLISDLFIPFGFNPAVYISFIAIVGIGFLIREKISAKNVALASLTSSGLFFLVTNFVYFMPQGLYPRNLAGMVESYIMAIPFFHYTVLGDLFFCGIFFGAFAILKRTYPALAR